MNIFYDQPIWIVVFGVIAVTIAGVAWAQTGKNGWLYTAGGMIIATLLLLGLERYLVSDAESLRQTVRDLARDIAKNDRNLLYPYLHSSATKLRQKADAELPSYEFTECTITKIYVLEIDESKTPRAGRVEFIVRVSGSFTYLGNAASGTFLRYVTLFLEKETDGKWRIVDYDHKDAQAAWLKPSDATKSP